MGQPTQNEKASNPSRNIYQRLAEAMSKVSYIQKTRGGGLQYSVVSHDAVTAKVRPALLDSGIVYFPVAMSHKQAGNRTEVALTVRFVNIDNPEEYIDVPALGYGIDSQDKGPGKAVSYAVKYALLKALGLETGDDPDLDQKVQHESDLEVAIKELQETIDAIKDGIATNDIGRAAEAWFELSNDDKQRIWVAPSKGGPFTTEERNIIKSTEFREAHYGAAA